MPCALRFFKFLMKIWGKKKSCDIQFFSKKVEKLKETLQHSEIVQVYIDTKILDKLTFKFSAKFALRTYACLTQSFIPLTTKKMFQYIPQAKVFTHL